MECSNESFAKKDDRLPIIKLNLKPNHGKLKLLQIWLSSSSSKKILSLISIDYG